MVNQPWVDVDMSSPMSQPEIKSKGGEAVWLASSLVFFLVNKKRRGLTTLTRQKMVEKYLLRLELEYLF